MEVQSLARSCLSHLGTEEQLLNSLRSVLLEIRSCLLANDIHRIGELIDQQTVIAAAMREVANERHRLRKSVAVALGINAEAATLSLVVKHCSGETKAALEDIRHRLRRCGEELHEILIANSSISLQRLEIFENVFRSLTGDQGVPRVYEPSGRRRVA